MKRNLTISPKPAFVRPDGVAIRFYGPLIVFFAISWSTVAQCDTVLERVLQRITVNGLFANGAQSGSRADPTSINASITNEVSNAVIRSVGNTDAQAAPKNAFAVGQLSTIGLGATNAGDLILSISAVATRARSPAQSSGLSNVVPAVARFIGDNTVLGGQIDMVQADKIAAMSFEVQFETWQVGAAPNRAIAALNLAANHSAVTARILNKIDGAVVSAKNMTTTALGAVNVGLADVIGSSVMR